MGGQPSENPFDPARPEELLSDNEAEASPTKRVSQPHREMYPSQETEEAEESKRYETVEEHKSEEEDQVEMEVSPTPKTD